MSTPISIRDMIAIEAMKIVLRGSIEFNDLEMTEAEIVNKSYIIADAMLLRRRNS